MKARYVITIIFIFLFLLVVSVIYLNKNKDEHDVVGKSAETSVEKKSEVRNQNEIQDSGNKNSLDNNKSLENKASNLLSENEFSVLTNKVLKELPLTKQAQAVLAKVHSEADKENHHHSVEYKKMNVAAGALLGDVKQAFSDNPKLKPLAAKFYKECILQKEFFPQVRGLCLYNYRHLVSKDEIDLLEVEYSITSIADKLE